MNLEALKNQVPDWARDLRLNLSAIGGAGELSPRLAWGTALAVALATRQPEVIAAISADGAAHLDDAHRNAAATAASLMAMNNVYYRFVHFMEGEGEYGKLPARLRMQAIANPGVDKLTFELWCLAVSAVNGCEACVRAHERVVREKGATPVMVQDAVRIAAIVQALAVTLDGARALAATPVASSAA